MRGKKTEVEVRNEDAARSDLSEGTFFYMFNPFGEETMREVLSRISRSPNRPRSRIIYVNPKHKSVFGEFPCFRPAIRYSRFNGQEVVIFTGGAPFSLPAR
ncbi:MAG TPA: hypothetical protein VLS90_17575 [Thermodesulfobacteriota bacterium]|nr:hypothetical protein [Thermodesulfobacteriota bacterium]